MAEATKEPTRSTKAAHEGEPVGSAKKAENAQARDAKKADRDEAKRIGGDQVSGSPIDPNTGEPQEENEGPASRPEPDKSLKPGAQESNEDFTATVTQNGSVEVLPNAWVGPAPLTVGPGKLNNLIKVLNKIKGSKPDDTDEDYELETQPDGTVAAVPQTPAAS